MRLTTSKLYTEPKLSPAKPESADMKKSWFVWFRFFNASTGKWQQLRYKHDVNQYKNYKERLAEINALRQTLKEELRDGWNPLIKDEVKIYLIWRSLHNYTKNSSRF